MNITLAVESRIALAVVGAHLCGQPLNYQLQERQARLLKTCKTASMYRLYALANTHPAKPGLVKVLDGSGVGIEVEVWEMNAEAFGSFVAAVPPPLVIGTLDLDDGSQVKGFLCEPYAIFPTLGTQQEKEAMLAVGVVVPNSQAEDISHYGGWRNYLASK